MTSFTRRTALPILVFLLSAGSGLARGSRIVAVGDIHGDYGGLVSILQAAGVIDARLRWSGGTTRLVQTGDLLDRGSEVKDVMDLLMRLEKEARRKRGEATILVGNHELMNLTGYLRDVNPAVYASFAGRKSQKLRVNGYKRHLKLLERRSKRYGQPIAPEPEAEWMARHPLGFIEYQSAIGPDGKYGRWLRGRSAVTQKDRVVFLHGGLSPASASKTLKEIDEQVKLDMIAFDRIKAYLVKEELLLPFSELDDLEKAVELELVARAARGELHRTDDLGRVINVARGIHHWSIYDSDGPLWFRGFAQWSDSEGEPLATELLKAFSAEHFVVGHTIPPDPARILPRFGGKVFLIDTGMLRGYVQGGRPSALEIDGETFTAIYANERVVLLDKSRSGVHAFSPRARIARSRDFHLLAARNGEREASSARPWRGPRGKILPFRTSADVEEFLRTSRFVSSNRKRLLGITKPQKVLVRNGRIRADAVFRSMHVARENTHWEDGNFTEYLLDSYLADLAAYEVGVLIGIENIPPTVLWKLNGKDGSLQFFIEDAQGVSSNVKPPNETRWKRQLEMMSVFDGLVRNLDRHPGNMLIDAEGYLWMIDHTRSFGRGKEVHNAEQIRQCDRNVWQRLKALDASTVRARLSPYLGPKEIDAFLIRKDEVIRLLQSKIDAEGEENVLFSLDGEEQRSSPEASRRSPRRGAILLAAQQLPAAPPIAPAGPRRWIGPDGEPLPFASDEEVLDFLQNARMIKSFDIPEGVTQPRKVLLEWNGVRAHAVFRDIDVEKQNIRLDDGFHLYLRDNYRSEVAAYQLGKLLGIDAIPPVVERVLFSKRGSLQIWVEKAMTEGKRLEKKLVPPDPHAWRRQLHMIRVFDNLVNNIDRNRGNLLIDGQWNVWLIDHTRTFGRERVLPNPKKIARCPRRLWERLTSTDDKTIRKVLSPYMGRYEIDALLKRRDIIIDLLKKRIETEGEKKVLFGEEDFVDEPVSPPDATDLRNVAPAVIPGDGLHSQSFGSPAHSRHNRAPTLAQRVDGQSRPSLPRSRAAWDSLPIPQCSYL